MLLAADWGVGEALWAMLWFFMFIIWIWMLIAVFGDIFRDTAMGGGSKALWCVFIIIAPFLGVLLYILFRGRKMAENSMKAAAAQDAAMKDYIRQAVKDDPSLAK